MKNRLLKSVLMAMGLMPGFAAASLPGIPMAGGTGMTPFYVLGFELGPWQEDLSRELTPSYLLDANLPQNKDEDRDITRNLYGGDSEMRIRQEIVLAIMGGIFVMETLSVMIQVASFKLTGKRVFRMAPIHHHFELKGWAEPKVIVRFWIITVILVLIGLASLKIR